MTSAVPTASSTASGKANTDRARARDFALVPLARRDWLVAALIGAVVAPLAWAMSWPLVGIFHDDGVYVVTAKALATGQGYRLIDLPGEPWQTKYPILFPALLSLVWRVWPEFPDNATALKALPITCTFMAAGVTYLYAVRFGVSGRPVAAAAVLAAFGAPQLVGLYGLVVSEPLFTLLLTLAVWRTDLVARGEAVTHRDEWLAGAALSACAITRSIGVFVVAGGLLHLVWVRRSSWRTAFPAVLPAISWFVWVAVAGPDERAGLAQYNTSYLNWWATYGASTLLPIVRDNLIGVVVHGGYIVLDGATRLLSGSPPGVIASSLAGSVLAACIAMAAKRRRSAFILVLSAYIAVVVIWPWPPVRFLIPVMPLTCVFGWGVVSSGIPANSAIRKPFSFAVGLFALITAASTVAAISSIRGPYAAAAEGSPNRNAFGAAFHIVRTLTPEDAVIGSLSEPMVYLYTGRKGTFVHRHDTVRLHYRVPPSIGSKDEVFQTLRDAGATHVLRLPMGTRGVPVLFDRILAQLSSPTDGRLRLLYEDRDADFWLFEVNDASTVPGKRP